MNEINSRESIHWNFMTQFPLPVYLYQVYSVAIYVDLPLKLK